MCNGMKEDRAIRVASSRIVIGNGKRLPADANAEFAHELAHEAVCNRADRSRLIHAVQLEAAQVITTVHLTRRDGGRAMGW